MELVEDDGDGVALCDDGRRRGEHRRMQRSEDAVEMRGEEREERRQEVHVQQRRHLEERVNVRGSERRRQLRALERALSLRAAEEEERGLELRGFPTLTCLKELSRAGSTHV